MACTMIRIVLLLLVSLYTSGLPLPCTHNRHRNGTWRFNDNISRKSFHCCGRSKPDENIPDDYLHNTTICGTARGGWDLVIGNSSFETQVTSDGCRCDAAQGRYTVNKREKYEWVPDSCHLLPWDGSRFCELLGNRTILFVGDSTMQQSASTVMSMVTRNGGKCANQLFYGRSYYLFFAYHSQDIYTFIKQFKPDICVMNAGPWMKDEGDMYSVLENMKNKWPQVVSWSPKTKYYWKTINPGHVDCDTLTEPIDAFVNKHHPKWPWFNFLAYDRIAHEYASRLNYTMIDMTPLYLRPDAHTDCMHFCVPGPLNILGSVMLTMLHTGEM